MNSEDRRNEAREAKDLLTDPAFLRALLALRKQWFDELMVAVVDGKKLELVAQLKALDMIGPRLQSYINREVLAQKGKQNG